MVSKGDEVWFSVSGFDNFSLNAITLSGRNRVLWRSPNPFDLDDISRDGRVLLTLIDVRVGAAGLPPGAPAERDLSWFAWTEINDLSPDGAFLLFTDIGYHASGSTSMPSFYLRSTSGAPTVRLGDGRALALSPDGKSVLAENDGLVIVPTGAGQPRPLPRGTIARYMLAGWFPDGQRLAFSANEPDKKPRCYVQDVKGGPPRPITPEGIATGEHWGLEKNLGRGLGNPRRALCGGGGA
jgi:hypothetical protein